MRHGEAGEARSDAERPLTLRGRSQALASARGLHALGVRVPRIWCSPYLRARQTADIVASVFGSSVDEDARFVPGGNPESAAEAVVNARDGVFVVAHMPILPGVVEVLAGGRASFGTAAVAHVAVVGGTGFLVGLFSSEFLEHVR